MGLAMFTKSGIFMPADYGLSQGDTIDVVLVGSGGYGASGVDSILPGYGAGGDTSLGTYAVAKSAYGAAGGFGWSMFTGYGSYYTYSGGGGGGGYVPGAPFQGGCGAPAPKTTGGMVVTLQGNGGGATQPGYTNSNTWYAQPTASMGGNGSCFGGGNASRSNTTAEGGAGYGGGGGCAAVRSQYSNNSAYYSCGGYAGQIIYYSHILTAEDVLNGIPVTVGAAAVYIKSGAYTATEYAADNTSKSIPAPGTGWSTQAVELSAYLKQKLQSADLLTQYFKPTSTGAYGVQPFCAYKDGTVFLAVNQVFDRNSSSSFSVGGIFVYSGTKHTIFRFSECFPGFSASPYSSQYFIYKVGNFFVQYSTHASSSSPGSNFIQFRCIPVDVALSGAATSSDVTVVKWLRPGSGTGGYSWGFDAAGGLICLTAANTYAYWDNWTPSRDQATYVSKTVGTNFWSYSNITCIFIPYGTKGAVCCYFNTGYSNNTATSALLTDAANGVQNTSTAVFNEQIVGICEGTNEVYRMCQNYTNGYNCGNTYGTCVRSITANPYNSSAASLTSTAKIFFAGAWHEYSIYSVSYNQNSSGYGFVTGFMWPTVDDGWIVMSGSTGTSTNEPYNVSEAYRVGLVVALKYVLSGITYGYDNNGGIPGKVINNTYGQEGIAGGAGGCCQITW